MEYRGVEYAVVQGIERGIWKWSASVEGLVVIGKEQTRSAAVTAAEKAIDRALAETVPALRQHMMAWRSTWTLSVARRPPS
jgi:hypothetical protein